MRRALFRAFCSNSPAVPPSLDIDLIITRAAGSRIEEVVGSMGGMLRLTVEGGGCNGFTTQFEVDTAVPSEDDVVIERFGSRVVIDEVSLDLVRGSTIDYEETMIRSSFVVTNNPNAVASCGCGVSFSLVDE